MSSKAAQKPKVQATEEEVPLYELTEPFYDNFALWNPGDEFANGGQGLEWAGEPSPSMIPLNEAAQKKHAEMIARYETQLSRQGRGVTTPLAELPDTLDGKVTVAGFIPNAKPTRGKKASNPFPAANKDLSQAARKAMYNDIVNRKAPAIPERNFDRFGGQVGDRTQGR